MIKNLSQLKQDADKYKWTMVHHSWFNNALIGQQRTVVKKQTNAIAFTPATGKTDPSWLYWSAAKDYKFEGNRVIVSLRQDGTFNEVMIYELELISDPVKTC